MPDPDDPVECPACEWRGIVAECALAGDVLRCPMMSCGRPVEMYCEAPIVVTNCEELAETK